MKITRILLKGGKKYVDFDKGDGTTGKKVFPAATRTSEIEKALSGKSPDKNKPEEKKEN